MRTPLMLVAVLAVLSLAGCYRDSTPAQTAPPANKVAAPVAAHDTDDELAFLPKESEFVVGVDMATLHNSAAWHEQIEPALAASNTLAKTRQMCGYDPVAALNHLSLAGRKNGSDTDLVVVFAGGDAKQQIACLVKQTAGDFTARADGDVTILSTKSSNRQLAVGPVGRSHVIALATPGVDAARLQAQLTVGAPLRSSPAFMTLYDKLDRGASLWFILNGSSPLFTSLSLGVRPRYIDGTIVVNDRYVWTTRITMSSPNDANALATTLRQLSAQAKQMVETFDIREEAEVVHVDIVLTQQQVQTILAMLGSFI